ncbi:MAG: HmuY family protein [Ignavibacteria bacterium]|nr:HmuY family protein [Ignavibacteria bacterium]
MQIHVSPLRTFSLALALCLIAFVASCCTQNSVTNGTQGTLTPLIVSNLRPDSLSVIYFSFDRDSVVPASRAATDEWDIRLPFLNEFSRSVDILLNSGNVNPNGKTIGIVVDSTFDLLTTAPMDSQLQTEDTASSRRIVSIDLFGKGMFNYNSSQRTIIPNPQKTLVLKTRSGNYVKVQFVNLYKDAAASPTQFTPLGYYRLRYVKNTTRTLK